MTNFEYIVAIRKGHGSQIIKWVGLNMWPLEIIKNMRMKGEQKKMQQALNYVALQVVIGLLKAFLAALHSDLVNGSTQHFHFVRVGRDGTEMLFNTHFLCYFWQAVACQTVCQLI